MWARGRLAVTECPRSYITAESVAWLSQYAAWRVSKRIGADMPARDVDAMLTLDREFAESADRAARTREENRGHK